MNKIEIKTEFKIPETEISSEVDKKPELTGSEKDYLSKVAMRLIKMEVPEAA